MSKPTLLMSGPGPHVLNASHDDKYVFIDNSHADFGLHVAIDPAVWSIPGWNCRLKRIWNRFVVTFLDCPTGTAPNGMPYRVDEFWTSVPLLEPMDNFGLMIADGRLWTIGKDHFTAQPQHIIWLVTRSSASTHSACTVQSPPGE